MSDDTRVIDEPCPALAFDIDPGDRCSGRIVGTIGDRDTVSGWCCDTCDFCESDWITGMIDPRTLDDFGVDPTWAPEGETVIEVEMATT